MKNPYLKPKSTEETGNEVESDDSASPVCSRVSDCPRFRTQAQHAGILPPSSPTRTESASALIISASAKAGMEGLDRTRMDEIILRESGNSKFMQQQRRRDAKVNQRIEAFQQRKRQAKPSDYAVTFELEQRLHQWQCAQATRTTCVVVDMDMFYMACELLNKPHLNDVPACVGRGMILTSNYPARKFGVRSAMPGWIGDKLVEELSGGTQKLVHVPSNFDLYKQKSVQVVEALKEFDPDLKSYSLDEAYLDLGPYLALYLQQQKDTTGTTTSSIPAGTETPSHSDCHWEHTAIRQALIDNEHTGIHCSEVLRAVSNHTCRHALEKIVQYMRSCVERATGGLTCSAGMAPNFSLAKIGSDKNKPNGQCFVDPSQVLEFVRPLPVRKIPGIGRVTEKILNACDIMTVQDLYDQRGLVHWLFAPATGEFLLKASIGCTGNSSSNNNNDLEEDQQGSIATSSNETEHQKGISRERTFQPNDCWTTLNMKLEDIAHLLSQDMIRKKVLAHTVTVKVKLHSFDVYSRSRSLGRGVYIQSRHELIAIVAPLFAQIRSEYHSATQTESKCAFSCRLLGIRCSSLVEEDDFSHAQQDTLDRFLSKSLPSSSTMLDAKPNKLGSAMLPPHSKPSEKAASLDWFLSKGPPKRTPTHTAGFESMESTGSPLSSAAHVSENWPSNVRTQQERDVECPLCQRKFAESENCELNQHVDTCLNGSTVRQAVRDTTSEKNIPRKKRQRLTDWWS